MLFVRVVLRLVANVDTFLEIAFQFILLMLCRGQFQVPEEEGECTPLVLVRIATHSTPYTKHRTHHMFTHNKVLFSSMYARPLLSVLFCSLCSPCSPFLCLLFSSTYARPCIVFAWCSSWARRVRVESRLWNNALSNALCSLSGVVTCWMTPSTMVCSSSASCQE